MYANYLFRKSINWEQKGNFNVLDFSLFLGLGLSPLWLFLTDVCFAYYKVACTLCSLAWVAVIGYWFHISSIFLIVIKQISGSHVKAVIGSVGFDYTHL